MNQYLKENKNLLVTYIISVPVAAICSAVFALCLQPLMDIVYTGDMHDFVKFALLQILFTFLDMGTHYVHKISREKLRVYYVAGLKRDLFNSLFRRNVTEFTASSVAEYVSMINRDVAKMDQCYFDSICGIYRVIVNFMINLGIVIALNPWVAVLNIMTSTVSVFIPRLFEKKLTTRQEKASKNSSDYYGRLNDYLHGFTTIKLFHIQKTIENLMEQSNRKLENSNCESVCANYTASWVSMLCSQMSYVFTIVIGIYFALKGYMTVGSVMAISQLIGGIVVPFEEMPEHIANLKSIKEIRKKMECCLSVSESALEKKEWLKAKKKEILLQQVSFSYEDKPVVQDVSLQLEQGKKYILLGESGCGKSTLSKLIMGFYTCETGSITYAGTNIQDIPEEQFYRNVTYLEQSVFLFDDTLRNNITLFQEHSSNKLEEILDVVGLRKLINSLPNGLETRIKGNGQNFSGGERQRIGIARALLVDADFMILDEITASLDPMLAEEIQNGILDNTTTGILMITHKWSEKLLRKADQILVMKHGRLVECGSFKELKTHNDYVCKYIE